MTKITVPIKEMGHEIGERHLYLYDSFMKKHLNVSQIDAEPVFRKLLDRDRDTVACPYCEDGEMQLVAVEPKYSGGMARVPSTLHHTGNNYTYKCTRCSAHFFGHHQRMWID